MSGAGYNHAWVLDQMAAWRSHVFDRASLRPTLNAFSEKNRDVVLFCIDQGEVRVETPRPPTGLLSRVRKFRQFLQDVVTVQCPDVSTTLAMHVADGETESRDVPLFVFQKARHSNALMLPDIDFIDLEFYHSPEYDDHIAYELKSCSGIFVGATTGGGILDMSSVRNFDSPRLRSAMHFRGDPKVDFRLPKIVQVETPEVGAELRKLGFGVGACDWTHQFGHKFLLSMDGNGATCSRVAIALKSNSVLMKYASDNVLFYFTGLVPWFHYIPISDDSDVRLCINIEEQSPGTFEQIAANGRRFYDENLTRDPVMEYAGLLIREYADLVGQRRRTIVPVAGSRVIPFPAAAPPRPSPPTVASLAKSRLVAHVVGRGDVASDAEGWASHPDRSQPFEGFVLKMEDEELGRLLAYRAVLANGEWSEWSRAGAFCGRRGSSLPLIGLAFRLDETAPAGTRLHLSVVLSDQSKIEVVGSRDAACTSTGTTPIVAFRVQVEPAASLVEVGPRQAEIRQAGLGERVA